MDSLTETLVREVLGEQFPAATFRTVESGVGVVVLASADLRCHLSLSPRGEFEISVAPLGLPVWQGWSYAGLVGRADLRRLLEIAGEQLRDEPRILEADAEFFTGSADDRRSEAAELNARASKKT